MKKLTLELYEGQNIDYLADNLRSIDRLEAKAMGYDSLYEAIKTSLDCATLAFIAKGENNEVLCAFGVSAVAHAEYGNAVWLVATDNLDHYQKEFVYYSKIIIKEFLKEWRLYNYISVNNDKSIRWLKRLGASFSEPFTINGEQFLLFILGGDEICV